MAPTVATAMLVAVTLVAGLRVENFYRNSETITAKEIHKCNFISEQHEVTSRDGYVTTTFRMHSKDKVPGHAVILQHGFLSSSDKWFQIEDSLPCRLAAEGHDVWLTNARGNHYSKKHTELRVRSAEYWQFSFHEMGANDLPAIIDYILSLTKKETVSLIGEAMGATMAFVMLAVHPHYNKKVKVSVSVAPACFLNNTSDEVVKFLALLPEHMEEQWVEWTYGELPHFYRELTMYENETYIYHTMEVLAEVLHMEDDGGPGYLIDSTSVRTAAHLAQLIRNGGHFSWYDHGADGLRPANYDLGKITAPQHIIYGDNDSLVLAMDVEKLCSALPTGLLVTCDKVNLEGFSYKDLLMNEEAKPYVNDVILGVIKSGAQRAHQQGSAPAASPPKAANPASAALGRAAGANLGGGRGMGQAMRRG